jgi:polyvinyl alcohol dehydrogenase (cytochrome)
MPSRNLAAIPLALGRMLFFGSPVGHVFHALDTETGRVIWLTHVRGIVRDGAVFKRGLLYFGDSSGYLWALDARTGAIVGVKKTRQRFTVGSPVIAGRTLVIGSESGAVIAIPLDVIRTSHDR